MQHKGKAERTEISPDKFEVGDAFNVEIGDWGGAGYSYRNVDAAMDALVIGSDEYKITAVSYEHRLEWNSAVEPDQDLEFTIHADGTIEGHDVLDWNETVKEITRLPDRGGEHMVREGRIRTGRE